MKLKANEIPTIKLFNHSLIALVPLKKNLKKEITYILYQQSLALWTLWCQLTLLYH